MILSCLSTTTRPSGHFAVRFWEGRITTAPVPNGAFHVAEILYSLCETAKLHSIDPRAYCIAATKAAIRKPEAVTMPEDLLKTAAPLTAVPANSPRLSESTATSSRPRVRRVDTTGQLAIEFLWDTSAPPSTRRRARSRWKRTHFPYRT